MTKYLLSVDSAYDIIKRNNLPAETWLRNAAERGVIDEDICISSVTPMSVVWHIDQEIEEARRTKRSTQPNVATLQKWRTNALKYFKDLAQRNRIIPMSHNIAETWGHLLDVTLKDVDDKGVAFEIGNVLKVDLATALIGRDNISFTYVDRDRPYHALVQDLVVEHP